MSHLLLLCMRPSRVFYHAHSVYVGQVNTARMEVLLRVLGSMEEEVFANREREAEKYARRCVLCRRLAYAVAGA